MSEAPTRGRSEYILPDGSPRYGIRTASAAEAPAPSVTPSAVPDRNARGILKQANEFTVTQLHTAAIYGRLLEESVGRESLEKLKVEHAEVLAESRSRVEEKLGTNRQWRETARSNRRLQIFTSTALPSSRETKLAAKQVKAVFAAVFSLLIPVGVFFYLLSQSVPSVIALPIYLALFIAARSWYGRIDIKVPNVPADISLPEIDRLKSAVIEAVFIDALKAKGVDVDGFAAREGVRRWEHLCFIAERVDQMWAFSRR